MGRKRYEPITVRFTKEALSVMREIADENGISVAEVVRMASAGNLADYFGDVRFVDPLQGAEIKAHVGKLADVMSDIGVGLVRVGTNINQIARRVNLDIAPEFAREIAPRSQAAVFVQADGKGGKLHVHVLVNDVRMDDGKGIDSSAYYFRRRGQDLRQVLRAEAAGAADEEDFAKHLRLDGVELVSRERKDGTLSYKRPATKTCPEEYYVYELADVGGFDGKIPPNLKSHSYKLGADFMPDAVAKLFQPQAQAVAEREEAIHMPEAPKPRKPAKEQERPEPEATEEPRTDNPEMERAARMARRIAFPEYAVSMGWGTDRPMRIVGGRGTGGQGRDGAARTPVLGRVGRFRALARPPPEGIGEARRKAGADLCER